MTVSTTTNSVVYQGNGSATTFAVPFKVLDEDHLIVKRRIQATGEVDITYVGTDYFYSGIGNDSGTLTLNSAALSSNYEIVIERIVPYRQELDLVNAGGFYPETVEDQFDSTTMQVQQIAAQSDDIATRALMVPIGDTAPSYEDFAAAFKGDPGGNVESVGLFTTLSAGLTAIPIGTDLVRSSGWSEVAIGDATYGRHADVDADYVTANPLTSFLTPGIAAAPGFRLVSTWITPWTFGAIGRNDLQDWVFGSDEDEVLPEDNVEAVQACLDYVASTQRKLTGDFRGSWGITDQDNDEFGLVINQPRYIGQTLIGGTFIALGEMTDLIRATALRTSILEGVWALHGGPFSRETNRPYADRLADNGITIVEGATSFIREIRVCGFKNWGVQDHTSGNNIMLKIGMVWGESCGSFHEFEAYSVQADFTSRTDTGGDGGYNQLSVLGGISDTSEFWAKSLVRVTGTGTVHYLVSKTSNSLSVYPRLPYVDEEDDPIISGEVVSMHGGIVSFSNNDSTAVEIDRLDGFHYGSLIRSAGLYGVKVLNLQGQIGSVTINLGANDTGEVKINRASQFDRVHSEGNSYDLVQVTPGSYFEIGELAAWGQDGDASLFSRTVALAPRLASGTLDGIPSYGAGLQGSIRYKGRHYYSIGKYNSNRNDGNDTITNSADGRHYYYMADNFTLKLKWDQALADVWHNAGAVHVHILGSGTDGEPTGTITVQVDDDQTGDGYTFNGGADVDITGLTARADIVAMVEPGTLNWRVTW